MKIHLFKSLTNLLREIAEEYRVPLPTGGNAAAEQFDLSDSIRRELIDAISTEFVATGLTDNEPNQRGIRLEELLDALTGFDNKSQARS